MVNLQMKHGLPFCSIKVIHENKSIILNDVLVDTGSGGTLLKMDEVEKINISIEPEDTIETIKGIGGCEFVYKKTIDSIVIGDMEIRNFQVEIGVMDYGFGINGIVGMDFLREVNAVIDVDKMRITKS